ncbi:hypothetical protein HKCCE2091_10870 [Rhodobacterales bacterium HKCCE2091]|nr:hypothetical protein [Rhodobacterales bacterium HKCCE2091]
MNIATRDREAYDSVLAASHQDLLVHAAKASGQSPVAIQRDFQALHAGPGKISFGEYVRLGLFHPGRYSDAERAAFISNELHWPIANKINNPGWSQAAEDKAMAYAMLELGGVPVPRSVAVIDRGPRIYPGLAKVADEAGLKSVLAEAGDGPIFGKILGGMVSFGAFRIEAHDATHIHCAGHAPMTYADFFTEVVGDSTYLLQHVLTNHEGLSRHASALATVRMVNLVGASGVRVPAAVIKVPQGGNIADAFWRPGNLACDIDVETGRLRTVARRGIEMEYLDDHPEHPGLIGMELPFWSEVLEVNARAAAIYGAIPYQSTDIAITADGPVVVELNYGGGFDLPQYASGRGLLDDGLRAFFAGHGVTLEGGAAKAKAETAAPRRGLFGLKR